jgi:hypothetical protein
VDSVRKLFQRLASASVEKFAKLLEKKLVAG